MRQHDASGVICIHAGRWLPIRYHCGRGYPMPTPTRGHGGPGIRGARGRALRSWPQSAGSGPPLGGLSRRGRALRSVPQSAGSGPPLGVCARCGSAALGVSVGRAPCVLARFALCARCGGLPPRRLAGLPLRAPPSLRCPPSASLGPSLRCPPSASLGPSLRCPPSAPLASLALPGRGWVSASDRPALPGSG